MGSLYKSGRIRSYILIILIIASFMISVPLKKHVNTFAGGRIKDLTALVYDKFGISIKYKSMSPSILSNFYIREIEVYNKQEDLLFSIDKTKLSLNIWKLINKDIQNGINNVTIDGVNLDVDAIMQLKDSLQLHASENEFKFTELKDYIPARTKIKNIRIAYDDEQFDALVTLKNVSLNNDAKKELLNLQLDANLTTKIIPLNKQITCKIQSSGNVTYQLEKSRGNVHLSDISDGKYHMNKLSLYMSYENDVIGMHTIQSVNPISLAVDLNAATWDINAQLKSKNLAPFNIVSISSKQNELKKLRKLTVDTDTIINTNLKDKNFNFISDTKANIPDEVFPGGFTANFSVFGNESQIEISEFSVEGENISGSASLAYVYDTMQVSGYAQLPSLVLNNQKTVSTEMYFEALEKGFIMYSPQLFLGDKSLTALQLTFVPQKDSYDFNFEVYDYSRNLESEPGFVQVDGSYLLKSQYLQANIGLNSLYFDSLAQFAAQVCSPEIAEKIEKVQDKLAPYVLSGDCYASTDLKSVSYNVPYILIANTQKENQVLMVTFDGSEQNISLNQLSLVFGQYALTASASLDKNPETNDMFFAADLNSASIPYHLSGSIMNNIINVSGDYGIDAELRLDKEKSIDGYLFFENLPVTFKNQSIIFSTDARFSYDMEKGPEVQMNRFEAELADSSVSVSPKVVMSGNMTKYGAQINSIAYSDLYSALEGSADLMLNINDKIFDSVGLMVNLKNPISDEGIIIDGSISNPERLPLNKDNIISSIYTNLQIQLNSFGLNRFAVQQSDNNRISAILYTSGTIEHPYVSLNIQNFSMLFSTEFLKLHGNFVLEDKDMAINDLSINYKLFNINDIQAAASLDSLTLDATGELDCDFFGKTLFAPLHLTIDNTIVPEGKILPDSMNIELSTTRFSGTLLKKTFPLSFSFMLMDNNIAISSSQNCGLYGNYSTDGILELAIENNSLMKARLDGFVNKKIAALSFYDFNADVAGIASYLNADDFLLIEKGNIAGEAVVTGSLDDPDINGGFKISNPEIKLPFISKQKLSMDGINLNIVHNEIEVERTILTAKSGEKISADFRIVLNKWDLNHIEGRLYTLQKDLFPVRMDNPLVKLKGDASFDLQLYFEAPVFEITGKLFAENLNVTSSLSSVSNVSLESGSVNRENILFRTDLSVTLGTHSSVNFDPIIRCVFVPNTTFNVKIDQADSSYNVDGVLKLKSGDLAYLNRNFYIKSGAIKFTQDNISNPLVTLTAETREKDDKNQNVKIQLSVENQYLLNMEPHFTSVPAKSENEIRSLLGQIVVADSSSAANFLFAASDYAIQSTLGRTAENKLRELFNFDIFSLRTNVLQNTLNMSVSGTLSRENLSIGNFLDNSTVYIGKYLGSSLYVDAMFHFSFEDSYSYDITKSGSLLFMPEFGMELESPFANIRLNVAPNINSLIKKQFELPATSLTLGWKFTF